MCMFQSRSRLFHAYQQSASITDVPTVYAYVTRRRAMTQRVVLPPKAEGTEAWCRKVTWTSFQSLGNPTSLCFSTVLTMQSSKFPKATAHFKQQFWKEEEGKSIAFSTTTKKAMSLGIYWERNQFVLSVRRKWTHPFISQQCPVGQRERYRIMALSFFMSRRLSQLWFQDQRPGP